jgi:hypothetical protein
MRPGDLVMAKPLPPHPAYPDGLPGMLIEITPRGLITYFLVMTRLGIKSFYENEVFSLPESVISGEIE